MFSAIQIRYKKKKIITLFVTCDELNIDDPLWRKYIYELFTITNFKIIMDRMRRDERSQLAKPRVMHYVFRYQTCIKISKPFNNTFQEGWVRFEQHPFTYLWRMEWPWHTKAWTTQKILLPRQTLPGGRTSYVSWTNPKICVSSNKYTQIHTC